MKNYILIAKSTFNDGCDRACALKAIFDLMEATAPAALNCDDILRSALVLSVSSFDLFLHEIFRFEVSHRLTQKKEINSLRIPFNVLISSEHMQIDMIDEAIRKDNSYKSFVAPDKLAECLRIFVEAPWDRIAVSLGEQPSTVKSKLKSVVDLRNRIAHEADVNPTYGGVELWPIYSEDVDSSIIFLRDLGSAVAEVINEA